MDKLQYLSTEWATYKEIERAAVSNRREVEAQILELVGHDKTEKGVKNHAVENGSKISITQRETTKIDAVKLMAIAQEEGLSDKLSTLFNWEPKIVATKWAAATEDVKKKLSGAITSKPASPSFKIKENKGN